MKRLLLSLVIIIELCFVTSINLSAQGSGKVTYEQIIDYGFKPEGNPGWDNFIKKLPKKGTSVHILSFANNNAVYEEDPTQNEPLSANMREAIGRVKNRRGPWVELKKVFYDFGKKQRTQQIEFMTRNFLIDSRLKAQRWKMKSKTKMVMDYVCLGAEIREGDDIIMAWFTSEIPISAGPGHYYGLPGLILGIEKNGEMLILAKSINLSELENSLEKPNNGKKISQKAFDKTVEEKKEEFKKTGFAGPRLSEEKKGI